MTSSKTNRSIAMVGAAALAVAAMGFAGTAQARDNVFWSVGVGIPGGLVNVGNVGSVYQPQQYYAQPQQYYAQPQPVYIQPQPVYSQPAPVYYQQPQVYVRPAPVYVAPQPIYYGRPYGHGHGYGHGYGHRRHEGQYVEAPRSVYGPGYAPGYGGYGYRGGYAPVYQQRDGRDGYRY